MEKVGKQICLDSDALIDLLNGDKSIIEGLTDYIIYITSISAFEYSLGNLTSQESTDSLSPFKILSLKKEDGILSANLFKKYRKRGLEIEFRDVMIAAICINNNISLLTFNKKHFERLKEDGLKLFEKNRK